MRDSYGDGWNNHIAYIKDESGTTISTLTGPETGIAYYETQVITLFAGVEYNIEWTSGEYPEEIGLFISTSDYSYDVNSGSVPDVDDTNIFYREILIMMVVVFLMEALQYHQQLSI